MDGFVNILKKFEYNSDVLWVSRYLRFTKAFISTDRKAVSHNELIEDVLKSDVMKAIEELELEANTEDLAHLHGRVREILDEIGYARSLPTIRWLALIVVKIIHKTLDGIYVNEGSLLNLKASMGDSPYVLVPTHRSYGDFILMAFVCFLYEIEIPCVAAGLDFLSMYVMGEILRKTKAFFIRRTFQDDKLYKLIFSQYLSTVVSQGDSPIEFFIEGTRSRTGKSLMPKHGFLSMILQPFLDGMVSDIKLVPVSISYDRILEEWLFARELLGTPKPKESTKGLFKVFSILNQNYGNVYINFGESISIHDWISREIDCPLPRPVSQNVKKLASLIIRCHSKLQIIGAFNLVMVVLYDNLVTHNLCEMPISLVTNQIKILLLMLQALDVNVLLTKEDLLEEISYACTINPELIVMRNEKLQFVGKHPKEVQIFSGPQELEPIETGKSLDPNKVMLLILYVNPVAMKLFFPSLLLAIIATNKTKSTVVDEFNFLCELYENEFPVGSYDKENIFRKSKAFLLAMGCVYLCTDGSYCVSSNYQVSQIFNSIIHPYLLGYLLISQYLVRVADETTHEKLLIKCQNRLNVNSQVHSVLLPMFSSKLFVTNCISALYKVGCLHTRSDVNHSYLVNNDRTVYTVSLLGTLFIHSKSKSTLKNKL